MFPKVRTHPQDVAPSMRCGPIHETWLEHTPGTGILIGAACVQVNEGVLACGV